ncbi:glycoside hydrolase family 3 N-terminal domain-containing protein [Actinomyces minihominis]|uniref:glycoside hydrolase family 3 N-terminal domain-containing protein n=1 Tax=Actinomyces minihominis TaxID=2002838 RepID=UPI001A92FB2A|nr:glycoside hydrolase family 3 N-terminal domain-containing protein [Actinomyces minihominis]
MNHFNILTAADTAEGMARWHNAIQKMAEETRLGIPITISTDPRHSYSNNPLAGMLAGSFSVWPEPIGFGAIADPALTETFGDIARQEYTAVGIRLALHPEVDLAILRVDAPYEEWPTIFENFFHSGSLDFPEEKIEHFKSVNLPR